MQHLRDGTLARPHGFAFRSPPACGFPSSAPQATAAPGRWAPLPAPPPWRSCTTWPRCPLSCGRWRRRCCWWRRCRSGKCWPWRTPHTRVRTAPGACGGPVTLLHGIIMTRYIIYALLTMWYRLLRRAAPAAAVLARIRRSVARVDLELIYDIRNRLAKTVARFGRLKARAAGQWGGGWEQKIGRRGRRRRGCCHGAACVGGWGRAAQPAPGVAWAGRSCLACKGLTRTRVGCAVASLQLSSSPPLTGIAPSSGRRRSCWRSSWTTPWRWLASASPAPTAAPPRTAARAAAAAAGRPPRAAPPAGGTPILAGASATRCAGKKAFRV